MKKNRFGLVLVLALATGSVAGWLALNQLRQSGHTLAASEPKHGKVQLAVAARDLPLGAVLRTEDVRLVDWPGEVLPVGYAATSADLVGRGVMAALRANEPILASKLADREAGGGLPILIPEGMRAVSVRVDEVVQVAGFVMPGTRVDVLATLGRASDEEKSPVTRVILQNVQVLAAGQTVQRDNEGKPQTVTVITLLVAPVDAEKLALASTEGRVQLALRSMLDIGEVATPGARLGTLVGAPRAPSGTRATPVRAAPRGDGRTVVETYRGGVRTLNTF